MVKPRLRMLVSFCCHSKFHPRQCYKFHHSIWRHSSQHLHQRYSWQLQQARQIHPTDLHTKGRSKELPRYQRQMLRPRCQGTAARERLAFLRHQERFNQTVWAGSPPIPRICAVIFVWGSPRSVRKWRLETLRSGRKWRRETLRSGLFSRH